MTPINQTSIVLLSQNLQSSFTQLMSMNLISSAHLIENNNNNNDNNNNLIGLPYIRSMPKITAISGTRLVIKCPAAGYPIESITWEQGR